MISIEVLIRIKDTLAAGVDAAAAADTARHSRSREPSGAVDLAEPETRYAPDRQYTPKAQYPPKTQYPPKSQAPPADTAPPKA